MNEHLLRLLAEGHGHPLLDALMHGLSAKAGFGLPLLALLLVLLWRRDGRCGLWTGLGLLLVVGSGDALGNLLKDLIGLPRPCADPHLPLQVAPCPGDASGMPSNHALNFFATFAYLSLLLRRWHWGLPLGLIAVGVAVSRVYLGAHYPDQVLVGALLGLAWGAAGAALARRVLPCVSCPERRRP